MNLLKIMKALGDETRLRIVNLLNKGELCVCELEHLLDINQSNASRHLNRLTEADVIFFEKRALYVYYNINRELYEEFPLLVEFLDKELGKLSRCGLDLERLSAYKASGISCEELKAGKMCFNNKEV